MKRSPYILTLPCPLVAAVLTLIAACGTASADVVTDWNAVMTQALKLPAPQPPPVQSRVTAMVSLAMFDAANGVVRKYEPFIVTDAAPPGARAEAAVAQAAYTMLSAVYPSQQAAYDAQLTASLAAIPGSAGDSVSIARGREWGAAAANAILAARANDGFASMPPPPAASSDVGYWRHPSRLAGPFAGLNFTATVPFLVDDVDVYDPGPPYGIADRAVLLASASYAQDVNEIQAYGSATSAVRTADQTDEALFISVIDAADVNRLLVKRLPSENSLVDNARIFALVNAAGFDATIVIFKTKYAYELWRPYQAIRNADLDGNPATVKDAAWTPLRPTPSHPEYLAGHCVFIPTLMRAAARLLGDDKPVELSTTSFAHTRTYAGFHEVALSTIEARVNLGVHFRETCEVSAFIGYALADEVVGTALLPKGNLGK